jgi:hypothetical protein
VSGPTDTDARAQDEQRIRAIVDRMFDAWSRGEGWRQTMRRRLSRQTMVVVRRGGRWQVTAFHNTRVRPLSTSGLMVEVGGRFVHWRTDRARRGRR